MMKVWRACVDLLGNIGEGIYLGGLIEILLSTIDAGAG